MALKVQSSFTAGELDPVLRERTTLAKYKSGLATARNVMISKTGSIVSRIGRSYFKTTKLDDRAVVCYSPPGSGYLLEVGHLYVRVYQSDGTLVADTAHTLTEDNLPNIHFETAGLVVYMFCTGKATIALTYTTGVFLLPEQLFYTYGAPASASVTPSGAPTGYYVDYAVTMVRDGQESLPLFIAGASALKLPLAAGQSQIVQAIVVSGSGVNPGITEVRLYRRPQNGGVYGYVGSSNYFQAIAGPNLQATIEDFGSSADYDHSYPTGAINPLVIGATTPPSYTYNSYTGCIYQQRLLQIDPANVEGIAASRPGYYNNFNRDYPLSSDSALKFKAGTSGRAQVLRMLEADGLVVFTTQGIYLSTGALTPDNLALAKKGKWVIKPEVPPLAVPGGVFFIDFATNTVRNLTWSTELASYNGQEVSTYSNHLFFDKEVTSWAFQEGNFPVLWVTFDDGTYATFTYEFEQEMRAWTRHDSTNVDVEQVVGTGLPDRTYFVCKKGTKRYIEATIPRYVPASTYADDPDADKNPSIAFMDSVVSYVTLLNDNLLGADVFTVTPVVADTWDGALTINCGTSGVFTLAGAGAIGGVYRMFDEDGTEVDLTVTARASDNQVTVTPSVTFPSSYATTARLYLTFTHCASLDHLEGENPAVIVDGYVMCSPNNDDQDYPSVTVTGGSITLPGNRRAAIAHIGMPIVADVETLDIDTLEQAPTTIEQMTINKLYVKTFASQSLYIGNKFPDDDVSVANMQSMDIYDVDYSTAEPIIGNRYKAPYSKRVEVTLPGDWQTNGKMAIRQPDPLHFEILSIIPDAEVLRREG